MKTKYSSIIVESLMTNDIYRFWKSDWSESIIVSWNNTVHKDYFFKDIRKMLGKGFIYERSLSYDQPTFQATNKGLKKISC